MDVFRRYLKPMSRTRPIFLLSLAAASAAVLAPASAAAAPAFYDGISADGSVAVFSTAEKMVTGDTDGEEDVYVRSFDEGLGEYITREVSIGPKGGNDTRPAHYDGISADGEQVFFSTRERLVGADTDDKEDVYVRNLKENKTVLASQGDPSCTGEGCGKGETDSSFAFNGVPAEGGKVFFTSAELLNGADKDNSIDIYVRDLAAGTTELVSAGDSSCVGSCGNGAQAASFLGTDKAGDKAFFATAESLSGEDSDTEESDIYERDLGAERTYLVSVSGTCPSGLPPGQNCEPSFGGASPDGSHVFFESSEQISSEDKDKFQDVYDWSGGTPVLASIGPNGGNGEDNVTYAGTSGDGGTVYFQTDEKLDTTADTDSVQDVYQRTGGVTSLVSAGEGGKGNGGTLASFSWASTAAGPQVVAFRTGEALTSEDKDSSQDVYERSGGVTTLVSIGPEGGNGEVDANFSGASEDGSKIFFVTTESLVAADKDTSNDIYMRSGGETVLVSAGQINGNGEFPAALHGVSADGSKAFFMTQERLTEGDDFAGEADVYSWSEPGKTLLVSVKNSADLVIGPPPPTLEGTNPPSPNASTAPAVFGQAAAGALIKLYKTSSCSGEPVAQGTAEELASPGLTVTVPAGTSMSFRATAEAEGIVSACSNAVTYTQQETLPPPPPPGEEGGGTGRGGTGSGGGTGGSGGGSGGGHGGVSFQTPLPKITFGPASKTRLRRPVFRFADMTGQPGTKFFCRIDRKAWSACSSPTKLKKVKLGRHVFSLKAVNAVGTPSASPVKRAFKVVR